MKSLELETSPRLGEIARAASGALAALDADRLEELIQSSRVLKRCFESSLARAESLAAEALDARRDLATLGWVLEATKANLRILHRRLDPGDETFGYGPGSTFGS